MSQSSDARRAIRELADNIKRIFKKYGRTARRSAWTGLTTGQGEKLIHQLLLSPTTKSIVGVEKYAKFREWMEANNDDIPSIKPKE